MPGSARQILQPPSLLSRLAPQVAAQRALFLTSSEGGAGQAGEGGRVLSSYVLEMKAVATEHAAGGASAASKRFLVVQHRAGGEAAALAEQLSQQFAVPLVPWGAVAADITDAGGADGGQGANVQQAAVGSSNGSSNGNGAAAAVQQEGAPSSSGGADAQQQASGRAFCFLPLPARTGLPVHINAFFELSSNRRDIW